MNGLAQLVGDCTETLNVDGTEITFHVPKHSDAIVLHGELARIFDTSDRLDKKDEEDNIRLLRKLMLDTSNVFYRLISITTGVTMDVAEMQLQEMFTNHRHAIPDVIRISGRLSGLSEQGVDSILNIYKIIFVGVDEEAK